MPRIKKRTPINRGVEFSDAALDIFSRALEAEKLECRCHEMPERSPGRDCANCEQHWKAQNELHRELRCSPQFYPCIINPNWDYKYNVKAATKLRARLLAALRKREGQKA
jgi:hypothetical protein